MNFNKTYAHFIKFTSARSVLSLLACHDLWGHQIDVVTAFLSVDLNVDTYMEVLQDVACANGKDLVCRIDKALYGLKQDSHQCNAKLDEFLVGQVRFENCASDPCPYLKCNLMSYTITIIALYVDYLWIGENSPNSIV